MFVRAFILALAVAVAAPAIAIVNGQSPTVQDRRFDAVGAFAVTWRLGLDPTNPDPATGDHNWYCAATLTGPATIHTAKHCVDSYGASAPHAVRFRRALDGSVGTVEAGVASFYHMRVVSWAFPGGDVAIGTLEATVPHIVPIAALDADAWALIVGRPIAQVAWGKEGPGPGAGVPRRMMVCYGPIVGWVSDLVLFPSAWSAPGACGINNNDSGGAVIVTTIIDRQVTLFLLGIIYGYDEVRGSATRPVVYVAPRLPPSVNSWPSDS